MPRRNIWIPMHRVAVVRSFAALLTEVGTPVERAFRRAGLPFHALENENNYVPSHRFWAFLVNVAHEDGIEDLGFLVGTKNEANGVDSKLTNLLRQAPTLYRGLLAASDLVNRTVSHCQVGLNDSSQNDYPLFFHSPSCGARNPAIEQIGWFGLMTLIGIARVFAGPDWQPPVIGVMTDHPPSRYIREQFPHTRIRTSQPYSYIALDRRLLSLPPLAPDAASSDSSASRFEPISADFVGSLEQILSSYVQEGVVDIEVASELCNKSKRSLQRLLAEQSTSFSEVIDRVRFRIATDLLTDDHVKIADISRALHYSDPTHFSRAFRRIAGVSPKVYRSEHAQ